MAASSEETKQYRRSEIWLADFGPQPGHRVQGIRPCVIVSNDLNNRFAPILQCIPISSKIIKKPLPVHVLLAASETGLELDSIAMAEQSTVLNKPDLIRGPISILNREIMAAIEKAILIHNGISF